MFVALNPLEPTPIELSSTFEVVTLCRSQQAAFTIALIACTVPCFAETSGALVRGGKCTRDDARKRFLSLFSHSFFSHFFGAV